MAANQPLTNILSTPPAVDQSTTSQVDPAAAGQQASASWLDSIPEAYRNDAHIKGHSGIESLLAEYGALKQTAGQGAQIPDLTAPFEQHKDFWTKLGVPEAADKYNLELPENSPVSAEYLAEITKIAHQFKIPNEALKALAQADVKFGSLAEEAAQLASRQELESRDAKLAELWGKDVETRSEFTKRAFQQFSSSEEFDKLGGADILTHPAFLHFVSKIGEAMQGPVSPGAKSSSGTGVQQQVIASPAQAKAAIDAMWADPAKSQILNNPKHPQHKMLNAELDALYVKTYTPGV